MLLISVRHAACSLSFLANATDTSEVTYKKQLVVGNELCNLCLTIMNNAVY